MEYNNQAKYQSKEFEEKLNEYDNLIEQKGKSLKINQQSMMSLKKTKVKNMKI